MFHKVKEVKPLPDLKLLVLFADSSLKRYDVRPLLNKWEAFSALEVPQLFDRVRVDADGYGVVWNDDLDLSCDELWKNGEELFGCTDAEKCSCIPSP